MANQNARSPIEKYISKVLLAIILLFAITSTGNVTEYIHIYHKGWTGITLGVTFGVTVFTCAYIAATAYGMQARITAIVIGSIFGFASATFQMNIYIAGGADSLVAASLSYIPIIAGEVGLAILEHLYSSDSIVKSAKTATAQKVKSSIEPVIEYKTERSVTTQLNGSNLMIESVQSSNLPVIAPRNERETEFWDMLNNDVQFKITKLARQWRVAPNTLRNWRERWSNAKSNEQQFATGD